MEFDISRLRQSHRLIGGAGIALFIFMFFFKWFGASASSTLPGGGSISFGSSVDGWNSLTNTRWLLVLTIIAALGLVFMIATQRTLASPVSPSAIIAGLALLSAIFVLYRIIDHPHGGVSTSATSFSYGAKIGLYLAFVACLVILYGGYLAMNEEGTSLADVREQASGALSSFSAHDSVPEPTSSPTPAPESSGSPPISPPPPAPDPPGGEAPHQQGEQ